MQVGFMYQGRGAERGCPFPAQAMGELAQRIVHLGIERIEGGCIALAGSSNQFRDGRYCGHEKTRRRAAQKCTQDFRQAVCRYGSTQLQDTKTKSEALRLRRRKTGRNHYLIEQMKG